MHIEKIRRWQWMLIALVVGGLLAAVRNFYDSDITVSYPNSINTQPAFERGLLLETAGRRHFKDIKVYPIVLEGKPAHAVCGDYYHGRPEFKGGARAMEGTRQAVWRDSWYGAPIPYEPTLDLAQFNKPGGPDYAAQYKALSNPTVVDFLKIMKEARNIDYTYAWWTEPKTAAAIYILSSLVLVGVVWPSIIYLIAYGSIFQPPAEKWDLAGARASTSATAAPKDVDLSSVASMASQLEESLKQDARHHTDQPAAAGAQPEIKQLSAKEIELAAIEAERAAKEFGQDQDDFYPTEVHHPKRH